MSSETAWEHSSIGADPQPSRYGRSVTGSMSVLTLARVAANA